VQCQADRNGICVLSCTQHLPTTVQGCKASILYATGAGCGLPPGPGGFLGAAEGLSYLTGGALAIWSLASKLSTGHGLPKGEPTTFALLVAAPV